MRPTSIFMTLAILAAATAPTSFAAPAAIPLEVELEARAPPKCQPGDAGRMCRMNHYCAAIKKPSEKLKCEAPFKKADAKAKKPPAKKGGKPPAKKGGKPPAKKGGKPPAKKGGKPPAKKGGKKPAKKGGKKPAQKGAKKPAKKAAKKGPAKKGGDKKKPAPAKKGGNNKKAGNGQKGWNGKAKKAPAPGKKIKRDLDFELESRAVTTPPAGPITAENPGPGANLNKLPPPPINPTGPGANLDGAQQVLGSRAIDDIDELVARGYYENELEARQIHAEIDELIARGTYDLYPRDEEQVQARGFDDIDELVARGYYDNELEARRIHADIDELIARGTFDLIDELD
ncbi:hypothetical protein C8J56DRAFT_883657 [Mycena floridula]|nr:hypothetical protein C8J56DRAFT_883657 [Mycena floridula]